MSTTSETGHSGSPSARDSECCENCRKWTPTPFKHSFCAALDQTKNQSWQTAHGWIVTPTSSHSPSLAQTTFCSGDCLFSYLFTRNMLSNKSPDVALHFFKRSDEQRPWLASQQQYTANDTAFSDGSSPWQNEQ